MWPRAVSFVNGWVVGEEGIATSVRFGSTILGVGKAPRRGDHVVDIAGAFVLPGLVNAHDHLELNHYGRLKFRGRHTNVSQWIDDIRPRLREDARIRAGQVSRPFAPTVHRRAQESARRGDDGCPSQPVLPGVAARVSHPRRGPIRMGSLVRARARAGRCARRVGRRSGGAPSSHAAGRPVLRAPRGRYRPGGEAELCRLERLGCLTPNVVLVHGVAIDPAIVAASLGQRRRACLVSGVQHVPVRSNSAGPGLSRLIEREGHGRIALGTDSRLSGSRDLLDEMRSASAAATISAGELLDMVTTVGATLLRQPAAGRIRRRRAGRSAGDPAPQRRSGTRAACRQPARPRAGCRRGPAVDRRPVNERPCFSRGRPAAVRSSWMASPRSRTRRWCAGLRLVPSPSPGSRPREGWLLRPSHSMRVEPDRKIALDELASA